MIQIVNPNHRIDIHIECFDDLQEDNYIAWISGDEYKGITVTGNSIPECMKELQISLKVLELYRKNIKIRAQDATANNKNNNKKE
jgi:DUF1365 family protein